MKEQYMEKAGRIFMVSQFMLDDALCRILETFWKRAMQVSTKYYNKGKFKKTILF